MVGEIAADRLDEHVVPLMVDPICSAQMACEPAVVDKICERGLRQRRCVPIADELRLARRGLQRARNDQEPEPEAGRQRLRE